jgi:hypothetical protein
LASLLVPATLLQRTTVTLAAVDHPSPGRGTVQRQIRRFAVGAATTAIAVVAVGGVGVGSARAGAKSPCKLVTAEDAKRALGVSVAAGKLQTVGLYQSCRYASGARSLGILERQLSRADFDKSARKNPGPVVHVAGIGTDAYSAGGGTALLLWKHGIELTLLATGVTNPLKTEKALGRTAASRL